TLIGFPTPDLTRFQGATSFWSMDKNWRTASTQNWSFNIQQGFGDNTVLQVGYIGNHSTHLAPYRELNPVLPAGGRCFFTAFGPLSQFWPCGGATYNALQASFKRRYTKGFTFNLNYTLSHSIDQGGLTFGAQAQNFADYGSEKGNSDYDARHNF